MVSGAERNGGVQRPPSWIVLLELTLPLRLRVGSREGASGEKLNLMFSGGGTWERVNFPLSVGGAAAPEVLAVGFGGCGSAAGDRVDEPEPLSLLGDNGQVVESGVGGAATPVPDPKPKLKPVSITGARRGRSGSGAGAAVMMVSGLPVRTGAG